MPHSLADRLSTVQPQMLRAAGETAKREGETDRKKLADLRPEVGRTVERAIELLGITKQDAAHEMGYADQGVVSRWCSATERPLFDKLFAIHGFRSAWIIALAERDDSIECETVVRVSRQVRRA